MWKVIFLHLSVNLFTDCAVHPPALTLSPHPISPSCPHPTYALSQAYCTQGMLRRSVRLLRSRRRTVLHVNFFPSCSKFDSVFTAVLQLPFTREEKTWLFMVVLRQYETSQNSFFAIRVFHVHWKNTVFQCRLTSLQRHTDKWTNIQ